MTSSNNIIELHDDKTDRIVYVGTEKECLEYSRTHPEEKFYFLVKNQQNQKDT